MKKEIDYKGLNWSLLVTKYKGCFRVKNNGKILFHYYKDLKDFCDESNYDINSNIFEIGE